MARIIINENGEMITAGIPKIKPEEKPNNTNMANREEEPELPSSKSESKTKLTPEPKPTPETEAKTGIFKTIIKIIPPEWLLLLLLIVLMIINYFWGINQR